MSSHAEETLANQIRFARLPDPVREHMFARALKRRWRFDFSWPLYKLACEVDGAVWTQGRHTRGSGVIADCEKFSTAAILGWRIIRVTPLHVKTGQALKWIEEALDASRETLEAGNG